VTEKNRWYSIAYTCSFIIYYGRIHAHVACVVKQSVAPWMSAVAAAATANSKCVVLAWHCTHVCITDARSVIHRFQGALSNVVGRNDVRAMPKRNQMCAEIRTVLVFTVGETICSCAVHVIVLKLIIRLYLPVVHWLNYILTCNYRRCLFACLPACPHDLWKKMTFFESMSHDRRTVLLEVLVAIRRKFVLSECFYSFMCNYENICEQYVALIIFSCINSW